MSQANGHADTERPRRLAAIDVGTNSIRLIIAEARPDGSYRVVDDEKETTRLGRGMVETGMLGEKGMRDSALTIARMKDIAAGYGVEALKAVGTCAVREAANADAFRAMVRQQSGLELDVITAEEEGRLAFASVSHAFDLRSGAAAVADIGGGSTELVLSSGGVVEHICTLPLGAVRVTEMFQGHDGPSQESRERMAEHVRCTIKELLVRPEFTPQMLIGTGGTFTSLASVAMHHTSVGGGRTQGQSSTTRGYEMQRSTIKHLLNWLGSLSPRARARVEGLSPERAEIIVAGVTIIDELMRRLKVNTLRVHDRGIRDGILLNMIREMYPDLQPPSIAPLDRMKAVRQFAAKCNYEQQHSDHVAQLAIQIFDQLAAHIGGGYDAFKPQNRELLEAAGFLHDVGYYINYSKHHKHSYHLIIHSDLDGFTHREIEIIANVARYHRRAGPKASHDNFAKLSDRDQELVRELSAILRIADGLDRAHAQNVRGVRVQVRKGTAWFLVHAESEPAVDIWGAARKSGLFLKAFDLEPRIEWEQPECQAGREGNEAAAQATPVGSGHGPARL